MVSNQNATGKGCNLFQVGDKVRIKQFVPQYDGDGYGAGLEWPEGREGVISEMWTTGGLTEYRVDIPSTPGRMLANLFNGAELEAA